MCIILKYLNGSNKINFRSTFCVFAISYLRVNSYISTRERNVSQC